MTNYWPAAKRKMELGLVALRSGRTGQAEQLLTEVRAEIAENEGVDSARWGLVTLKLAFCATWMDSPSLVARRSVNALRAFLAADSSRRDKPVIDAAVLAGCAFDDLEQPERAIRYLTFASQAAHAIPGEVRASSRADYRLANVLSAVGRNSDAADAAWRAWSTIDREGSWMSEQKLGYSYRAIELMQLAGQWLDASLVWEWLFTKNLANEGSWFRFHNFVGGMAGVGLSEEAKSLFDRAEYMYVHGGMDGFGE